MLVCGTRLDYFWLKSKLQVGRVSNMYHIVQAAKSSPLRNPELKAACISITAPHPPRQRLPAVARYLDELGGPYGRSAYHAVEVSRRVEKARDSLAARLGVGRPELLSFMPNATTGLNLVLQGFLRPGDEVLVSGLEHNAVMRPLEALKRLLGITWRVLPCGPDGLIQPGEISHMLTSQTRLVVVNHQSNVNGLIQPLKSIKEAIGDVPLLVDAAQSAGTTDLKIDAWNLDFVACTGHKGCSGRPVPAVCLYATLNWSNR